MSMIAVEGRTEARRTSASGARARRPRDLSRAAVGSGVVIAVRTAPPLDPPFEDEQQPPVSMELLPFDWSEADVERRQISPPKRRLPRPPQDDGSVPQPRSTPTVTARAALQRYIGMCVEVLNGYRPAAHLRPRPRRSRCRCSSAGVHRAGPRVMGIATTCPTRGSGIVPAAGVPSAGVPGGGGGGLSRRARSRATRA